MTDGHGDSGQLDEADAAAGASASDVESAGEVAQASEFGGEASKSTGPDGAAERWDRDAQDEDALLGRQVDDKG